MEMWSLLSDVDRMLILWERGGRIPILLVAILSSAWSGHWALVYSGVPKVEQISVSTFLFDKAENSFGLHVWVDVVRVVVSASALPTHPLFPLVPVAIFHSLEVLQIVRRVILKVSEMWSWLLNQCLPKSRKNLVSEVLNGKKSELEE